MSLRERTGHFGSLLSVFPVEISMDVDRAVQLLAKGQVIGMPTETVYGLAGNIESSEAIEKIFRVKERPYFDPLIVHVADIAMVKNVVETWSETCQKLAEEFWPGPLTIVTKKSAKLNPLVTSGLDTVAVRMPAHPVALGLISKLGKPLAAPSANKFGKTSPTRKSHVVDSFPELFVLEGGDSEIGLESTVVEVNDDQITILRPGFVTLEELQKISPEVTVKSSSHSPGHLENHYQPDKPLLLVFSSAAADRKNALDKIGLAESARPIEISLNSDPYLAARELYVKLRESARQQGDYIELKWSPQWKGGIWDAILDRAKKASSAEIQ